MTPQYRFRLIFALVLFPAATRAATTTELLEEQVRLLKEQVLLLETRVSQLEGTRPQVAPSTDTRPQPLVQDSAPAEQPKKLGPVSFNGEFRLYFDNLTRPAGGGAPRVSNIRGRYLMHLDFKAPLHRSLSVQGRLSTGTLSNPLTDIQDFGAGAAKHPFFLSEAFVDFHPNPRLTLQAGRLDSPFNDRSRFLFDIDTRFNGTTEIFRTPFSSKPWGIKSIDLMAGQYTFTNPNFPVIQPGEPSTGANATPSQALLAAGAAPGSQPRASQLFQQGFLLDHEWGAGLTGRLAVDAQLYRNPNQLRLLSTPAGVFLVGNTLGLLPAAPLVGPGNATRTPNGAMLSAPSFKIAHVSYTLAHPGFQLATRKIPISANVQFAPNLGATFERNAFATIVSAGRSVERGDIRVLFGYYLKQANSLLSELTENDIAIGSSVNMSAHLIRTEFTLSRDIIFANNLIFTSFLRDSNPSTHFYPEIRSST